MNNIKAGSNSLSLASLVFGILAVIGSFVVVPTPLLAGLAITFAWLSRGDRRMGNQAIAGNILALIAIAISIIILTVIIAAAVWAGQRYSGFLPGSF